MDTYSEDWLVSDSAAAPPASPLFVPNEPGIGLAAPEVPAAPVAPVETDPVKALIAKMGPGEKFLSALGEVGNAMLGRGSPLKRRASLQQDERRTKLAEFKVNADALEDSVKWAQRLQGSDRTNFVNVRVQQLNEQSPGLGDQFRVFSEKPDLISGFRDYAKDLSEPLQLMMKSNPEGFMKFAATPEGVKALEAAKDKSTLRLATKKAQTAIMGWDQFAPPTVVANYKKDGVITASEFMDAQKYIPEAARLSEGEIEVAMRTPGFWQALNIVGPADEADVNKQRLKDAGKQEKKKMSPATVSVGGKNVSALVDEEGNYYDANTRQKLTGVAPQISAADDQRNRDLAKAGEATDNMEKAVNALEKITKNHPRSAAGLFSAPARGIEYVAGSLNPGGKGTSPATQAVQLRDSILANMGNLSRMSNADRERIENALQVGSGGNPRNLPLAIQLLRDNIKKERAAVDAPRGRTTPGAAPKKKPSEMTDEELLKELGGG